jgi:hypothetical protein
VADLRYLGLVFVAFVICTTSFFITVPLAVTTTVEVSFPYLARRLRPVALSFSARVPDCAALSVSAPLAIVTFFVLGFCLALALRAVILLPSRSPRAKAWKQTNMHKGPVARSDSPSRLRRAAAAIRSCRDSRSTAPPLLPEPSA